MELAELVVEAEVFPAALSDLRDPDEYVQKNVATLIREVSKHTPEVAIAVNQHKSTFIGCVLVVSADSECWRCCCCC